MAPPTTLPARPRGIRAAVWLVIGLGLALPGASTVEARGRAPLDLTVRMADVRAPAPAAGPELPPLNDQPPEHASALERWAAREGLDELPVDPDETGVPRRDSYAGEGGFIEELLEGTTIPIFRIRVRPPF